MNLHPPTSTLFPYTTLFRSNLPMIDTAGNFSIPLPTNLVLSPGSYWVSVQANMDFTPFGDRKCTHLNSSHLGTAYAVYRFREFSSGCLTWGARAATCGIDGT